MSSQPPPDRGNYSHIPIPTYEEATSSRSPSSQRSFLGSSEVSHDAERQGLLGRGGGGGGASGGGERGGSSSRDAGSSFRGGYRPPTVESARSSFDSDVVGNLPSDDDDDDDGEGGRGGRRGGGGGRASMEELRREMSEMEFDDGTSGARSKWSARGFASAFNFRRMNLNVNVNLRLPRAVRAAIPSWQSVRAALPRGGAILQHVKLDFSVLIRVLALIFVIGVGYLIFFSDVFRIKGKAAHQVPAEELRRYLIDRIREGQIRTNVYKLSSFDHLTGTEGSYVLGDWVKNQWLESGLVDVSMDRYEVYVNYPKEDGRKVAIVEPEDKKWTAMLEEKEIYPGKVKQTPVFHGHSKSGSATGPIVYANYGSQKDYAKLKDMGIKIEGSVVLLRHGGSEPAEATKIKTAETNGAVGVLIYSDPADQDKDMPAMAGQWRADDAVERGSASNGALVLGDVLSPGYASTQGEKKRLSLQEAEDRGYLPKIPSMPLSWLDAQNLLKAVEGVGKELSKDAPEFVGEIPYINYWSGGEASPKVLVENENDEVERQPIYNVLGRIKGAEQPASKVIIGNHRDAWCFGALDPGSGTAIMMEVSRAISELTRAGWSPARTIEFASWDGEAFNVLGSTEHVEENVKELREHAAAYINVGIGAFGPDFWASASPSMERPLGRTLERIWDDHANETLRTLWNEKKTVLNNIGGASDSVPFQDIAGVASVDMGFRGSSMPYHSCHDNFQIVDEKFDQGFRFHKLMAQTLALLVLELADSPLLPLDMQRYAETMEDYVKDLRRHADEAKATTLDFAPLDDAVGLMKVAAKEFHVWEDDWEQMLRISGGFETAITAAERADHNNRAAAFEKGLLDLADGGGLPGRQQFKHAVFAPDKTQVLDAVRFPAVVESIDAGDMEMAQQEIAKVASLIESASKALQPASKR